ncbi:MAG: YgaC family protein [Micrococcaceae bacterium]|nr:YgaC family protein [Micrococcaceae bacterium]MDN5880718.1 YgaC family protein [Micrococcaceae bacterium]MDN5887706.1 YgaC family protein [Micrococcaceae bacterium]MDN5906652.1 YgaC family protein [Micrococcaceae bacterium]MDN6169519.1 YgaC family protein [Micrococcaceae bacterium]
MNRLQTLAQAPGDIAVGDQVIARAWKYDGWPHWVVPGRYLGADEYGHWVIQPAGSLVARPGAAFAAESDVICLFPHDADWVATFYDDSHPGHFRLYIDVSRNLGWRALKPSGWEFNSIDMDLDVVRSTSRGIYLDDEDEFEDHALSMGYPQELAQRMRDAARELLEAVEARQEPFGASADVWFDRGRRLLAQAVG